ncbi:hypothetical protein OIU84_002797 [Salix udensis]|uniref:Homeobox domain-containing protein n=1 Tax=Salix udensis TaxID=889485 RepID=A0AAD6P5G5_9ROSI|nr:hypothetical protein OIU84_002797 [Salix udensis]
MQNEVTEMEAILQEYNNTMPAREVLVSLAEKFSESPDRKGNIQVQMKQVWNWFQNRRGISQQVAAPIPGAVPATTPASSAAGAGRATSENSYMEFEAKSARDGAWYDVGIFLSHRYLDKGDPEVLVRFSGFGPDEDEWLDVRRQFFPGDLTLCFQEGKDQALYFDAHVLDAQRRRHDVRGCRCRFLVRYDHDQSEEIVPLRKICRRPETDYRLLQLHAANDSTATDQKDTGVDPSTANTETVDASASETTPRQQHNSDVAMVAQASHANVSQPVKTM